MNKLSLMLLLTSLALGAHAENAVVGTGTPASCTAATYNAALSLVVNDNQGGTLTFNCGPNPHTININGARILQNFVVIDGGGKITLDAQDASRFFVVNQDGPDGQTQIGIQNIRLNRGNAGAEPFGGAILTNANTRLDLNNVIISNSLASVSGGAIANVANTVLNVVNSQFIGNLAANGGAIATRSTIMVISSSFTNNNASGGEGGAIQSLDARLDVIGSYFNNNGARYGGAIFKGSSLVVIVESNFNDNTAADDGGAIYFRPDMGIAFIDDSNFRGNRAVRDGGAIYNFAELDLFRVNFAENSARAGGALHGSVRGLRINDVTFSSNTASTQGAAIFQAVTQNNSALEFNYVTTHNNTVTAGSGGDFALSFGSGSYPAYIVNSTLMGASSSSGGSILQLSGSVNLEIEGSLLWHRAGSACNVVSPATITSQGGNLGQLGCSLNAGSDAISSTFSGFGLAEFANYGGRLGSFLPLPGSPAIDRNSDECSSTDVRGKPSPVDGDGNGSILCDAGSVERQLVELPGSLFRNGFEN